MAIISPLMQEAQGRAASAQPVLEEIERALVTPEPGRSRAGQSPSVQLDQRMSKLASSLRRAAMVVLLTAAGSSLFQGWAVWDSTQRIAAFVAFIAALAATGLLCAFKFRDNKGARVSLGIAAATIPVAFSQTGGLIYSLFISKEAIIPDMLRFTAPSATAALITAVIILLLLTPVAFAGFSVLARSEARGLTALYMAGNAALLLPTRDSTVIGLASMLLLGAILAFDVKRFHRNAELRTVEGGLSRAMMFTPFAILVIRNIALYSVSTVLIGCLFAVVTAFLFMVAPNLTEKQAVQRLAQAWSTVTMAASWFCFSQALFFERNAMIPLTSDFVVPMRALPVSAALVVMSLFTLGTAARYRRSAAYLAIGAMMLQLMSVPGMVSSFFCILTAIACISAGCIVEEKGLFIAGCWGLVLGVLYHLRYAVLIYSGLDPWVSLAVLGIATLLAAAYLEKNHRYLLAHFRTFQSRVRSWD